MFGKLPKPIVAAKVLVCSNAATALTVPLALVEQQLKPNGYTVLTQDAALSVIAAAQGSSKWAKSLRIGLAAVELAALASSWSGLSVTVKDTLNSSALVGAQGLNIISTAIPSHVYLSLQSEALADPLQISALQCAKPGIVLVEADSTAKSVDLEVTVQSIETQGVAVK
jgi:hypothetical protein